MSDDGGVAAVDRALTILDALTDEKTTLAELSKRTDLYKSTLLRLIKSLERFGYVLRDADGCYRLGSKVLYLGSLYHKHFRTRALGAAVPLYGARGLGDAKSRPALFQYDQERTSMFGGHVHGPAFAGWHLARTRKRAGTGNGAGAKRARRESTAN